MVKFALEIVAQLENIKEFYVLPLPDMRWYMKIKCSGCGEAGGWKDDRWIYLDDDEHKTQNGQTANYVAKCRSCKREMTISILHNTIKPYKFDENHPDGRLQQIVQFEARGVELTDYEFRAGWNAKAAHSTTRFEDIDFGYGDNYWGDYDEKASEPVGIYNITSQFVKL